MKLAEDHMELVPEQLRSEVRNEIRELKTYYQEFHHKCLSWYILLMGFFIAGSIAAEIPAREYRAILGGSIIVFSTALTLIFYFCMAHYSARIDRLGDFLPPDTDIPHNWHQDSTDRAKGLNFMSGAGSRYFLGIIVTLQLGVIWLSYLKYLR